MLCRFGVRLSIHHNAGFLEGSIDFAALWGRVNLTLWGRSVKGDSGFLKRNMNFAALWGRVSLKSNIVGKIKPNIVRKN